MMHRKLLFFVVACFALCSACSTKNVSEANISKDDLYEKVLNEKELVAAEAARYLKRTVLEVRSDNIRTGVYSPSELYERERGVCESELDINQAFSDMRQGRTDHEKIPRFGPFADLPQGQRAWRSNPQKVDFGFVNKERKAAETRYSPLNACIGIGQSGTCESKWRLNNDAGVDTLKDLDYVIYVKPSVIQECEMIRSTLYDKTRPFDHDIYKIEATKEAAERDAELAAAKYDDKDLVRLVKLLPLKYRGKADTALAMPDLMRNEVLRAFDTTFSAVMAVTTKQRLKPALTFDRNDVLDGARTEDYGAWFQAIAPIGGGRKLYLSPLLARAPFYICYNKGAFNYVEARFRFIKWLTEDREDGWDSRTIDDVKSIALNHRTFDARYRKCVESQLAFVISHEIAHLLQTNASAPSLELESQADCFALSMTARSPDFDLGLFQSLILDDENLSKNDVLKKRAQNLERLRRNSLSRLTSLSADEAIHFCQTAIGQD